MFRKLIREFVEMFRDLLRNVNYNSPNISPYENAQIRLLLAERARREQETKELNVIAK